MWRENAINKIDDLILYIDYLAEVEDSEFDGTEEGYEIVVNHINSQNMIRNILNQIKKDYILYSGYEDLKEKNKRHFYEKFKVISYLLLVIDEYNTPKEDLDYFKRLKDRIKYDD